MEAWHLDKRIPIALIAAIIAQSGSAIWWASGVESRVNRLETTASSSAMINERVIRLEEQLRSTNERIEVTNELLREIREELRRKR